MSISIEGPQLELLNRFFGVQTSQIVQNCCNWILENAVNVEGIFRNKADERLIEDLRIRLEQGDSLNWATFKKSENIHVIPALLKSVYRHLPEPVFPFDLYDDIVAAQKATPEKRDEKIRAALNRLPATHAAALHHLVRFLRAVAAHSAINCMPTANLAIVFAPSVLRPREESIVQIVSDAPFVNAVLQSLLDDPKLLAVVWSRFSISDGSGFDSDSASRRNRIELSVTGPRGGGARPESPPALTPADLAAATKLIANAVAFLWDASSTLTADLEIIPSPAARAAQDERAQQLTRLGKTFGPLLVSQGTAGSASAVGMQPTVSTMAASAASYLTPSALGAGSGGVAVSVRGSSESLPAIQLQPSPAVAAAAAAASVASAGLDGGTFLKRAMENLRRDRVGAGRQAEVNKMTAGELRAEKSVIKRELRAYDAEFMAQHGREPSKQDKEPMRPLYQRYKDVKMALSQAPAVSAAAAPAAAVAVAAPVPAYVQPEVVRPAVPSARPITGAAVPDLTDTVGAPAGPGAYGAAPPQPPSSGPVGLVAPLSGDAAAKQIATLKAEKRALQVRLTAFQKDFIKQHGRKVKYREDRLPMENEYQRYKMIKAQLAALGVVSTGPDL